MRVRNASPDELRRHTDVSAQGQVTDFLRQLRPEETGIIPLTPNQIALQTGVTKEQVSKTLSNLKMRERIDLVRGPNGREIVGIKPLDLEPRQRGGPRQKGSGKVRYDQPVVIGEGRRRLSVQTPALEEYARAKSRFEALQAELGDLISATFNSNPYAEEGLRLRDRLANIDQQVADLRSERDELQRDLNALRGRKQTDLREAAEKAGAMVVNGD